MVGVVNAREISISFQQGKEHDKIKGKRDSRSAKYGLAEDVKVPGDNLLRGTARVCHAPWAWLLQGEAGI